VRIAAVALSSLLSLGSQPGQAATSPISVLPALGRSATYVVAETKHDLAHNNASNDSETITLTAQPDMSFDADISGVAFQRHLRVKPWPGGTLDTNGTAAGATFWAQDLNATISLLTGRGAMLNDGASWTTQPVADTTAIDVPDMSRQNGTTKLLLPILVHVTKAGTSWRVDGSSTDDQGNNPVRFLVTTVRTAAVFSSDGTLIHADGSIKYGPPASVTGTGEQGLIFTRSWTIDPGPQRAGSP
jgi:hypothetical protein